MFLHPKYLLTGNHGPMRGCSQKRSDAFDQKVCQALVCLGMFRILNNKVYYPSCELVPRIMERNDKRSIKYRELLLDLAAGALVVVAASLILNREFFGLASSVGWTVSYGNF